MSDDLIAEVLAVYEGLDDRHKLLLLAAAHRLAAQQKAAASSD
jgi:hypothetical protein